MNTKWKSTETEHYIFHYKAGSLAERELDEITTSQESCFMEITATIKIELPVKIPKYERWRQYLAFPDWCGYPPYPVQ